MSRSYSPTVPARRGVGQSLKLQRARIPSKTTLGSPQIRRRTSHKKSRQWRKYDANRRHSREKSGDSSRGRLGGGRPVPSLGIAGESGLRHHHRAKLQIRDLSFFWPLFPDMLRQFENRMTPSAGGPHGSDGRRSHSITDEPEMVTLVVSQQSRSIPCSGWPQRCTQCAGGARNSEVR